MSHAGGSPRSESLCWGGLDRALLAVLLRVGAQALWLAGEIPGGLGLPQLGAPPELCWSLTSMCPKGRPLASTPGTSPELMEPETSNHRTQLPALMGACPGSTNSAPFGLPPQKHVNWDPSVIL